MGKAWNAMPQTVNNGLVKSVRVTPGPFRSFFYHFLVTSEEIEIIEPTEQDFKTIYISIFNAPTAYEIILLL